MLEEKIRSEFLVLITGEIGQADEVALEAEGAKLRMGWLAILSLRASIVPNQAPEGEYWEGV